MLTGVFLKNIKIYKNQKFIPISNGDGFSAFVGPNGAGKSSVLEAIDVYFNNSTWNVNKHAKKAGETTNFINLPYVCPVFLLEENEITSIATTKKQKDLIKKISDYLWANDKYPSGKIFKEFSQHVDVLKAYGHGGKLLVIGGVRFGIDDAPTYFGPFHQQGEFLKVLGITASTSDLQLEKAKYNDVAIQNLGLGEVNESIRSIYTYLYIPADTSVAEYTKLETLSMQALMGRDLNAEIGKAINASILEKINKSLDDSVTAATEGLSEYKYEKPTGGKKNITLNTLSDLIKKEYFSIRVLSKIVGPSTIAVSSLSSGEQRRALIDLTANYLTEKKDIHSKTIIAIDEPEISLHTSLCFDQFEDLFRVAHGGTQTIVTTHWYGFLPIAQNGAVHFLAADSINESVQVDSYDLANYREKANKKIQTSKGEMPFDISLKSANDLVQAIASSLKASDPYSWVLCEGSSEQIYFSHFLKNDIAKSHLRLLPLGGAGEVVKIYRYLEAALSDKSFSGAGKVLAVIDTDKEQINYKPSATLKNLSFKRLLLRDDDILELLDVDASLVSPPTDVEDVLDPKIFIDVLKTYDEKDIGFKIEKGNIKPNAKHSGRVLDLRLSERTKMDEFFAAPGRKVEFAKRYVARSEAAGAAPPPCVALIKAALKLK